MDNFIPGVTPIPASTSIITDADKQAMHSQIDKGWLTAGPVNDEFETALYDFTGIPHVRTCNSGSSANLLAVATMVAEGKWKAGDEIITAACGFPTTVNPLILYGLVPVFVDIHIPTYDMPNESVAAAITPKTKGLIAAHTLGNPVDWYAFSHVKNAGGYVIEDCCDALGSIGNYDNTHVGTYASIATCSFFPAHHITCGEGGAVFTSDKDRAGIIESIRDWGRDCYCQPGKENTCGKRFEQQFGELPYGYDHKYTYSHLGYNLKITEVQAACGLSQIARLPSFIYSRRKNWNIIRDSLACLENEIILPQATAGTNPSWFGFAITIRKAGQRQALQEYLASYKIGSRLMFGGNLTKQPYMNGRNFRISGSLENTDKVMNDSLWIGCHPHLTIPMIDFMCDKIKDFFA